MVAPQATIITLKAEIGRRGCLISSKQSGVAVTNFPFRPAFTNGDSPLWNQNTHQTYSRTIFSNFLKDFNNFLPDFGPLSSKQFVSVLKQQGDMAGVCGYSQLIKLSLLRV
jgi:hypothetical protein